MIRHRRFRRVHLCGYHAAQVADTDVVDPIAVVMGEGERLAERRAQEKEDAA